LVAQHTEAAVDFPNEPHPERPLRVGYVSPDFRQHASNSYSLPLLTGHDRRLFDIFLYAEVPQPDAVSDNLRSLASHWRSTVGLSDAAVRQRVHDDQIDILVDLAGHTDHTRIAAFAVKPAPVTVTWLGYPNTTGLPTMDYRLTDALADPPGETDHLHTEALVRLPHCFLCYQPPAEAPPVAPTPALSRGTITFGSFNNLEKVTTEVIETWAAVLRSVPRSRLLLKGWILADPVLRQRINDRFAALGIDAGRLDLRRLIPGIGPHLALYREIDIGLDPFPYNGTTTTCEALWMGVPVVSLIGDSHAARVGLSLLSSVGLQRLVAHDRDAYVTIAAGLAKDLAALEPMRQGMRSQLQKSPLMDAPRFARDVESAYRVMWRSWCARRSKRE
jgi:protein O-GlcNAc transferase